MANNAPLFRSQTTDSETFFHRRLQRFVADILFPEGKGDWYKLKGYGKDGLSAFDDFIEQNTKAGAHYHEAFKGLEFKLSRVDAILADGKDCELEMLECKPEAPEVEDSPFSTEKSKPLPGKGKHIVYFPGANTYYQACFRDISTAAKETGATIHAFNFPGTGASTGKVKEAKDCINAGIAAVNALLKQGIAPDDIIIQGDCYGAAIAYSVKQEFKKQSGLDFRIIMNNSFKSFKAAVCDMITNSPWLPNRLKSLVKTLLEYTGWHVTPGKDYKFAGPYQAHVQHFGDQTLVTSTLSSKVQKYTDESKTKRTSSKKRAPVEDTCPEDYLASRDRLDAKHYVRVKEEAKPRLAKWGVNQYGQVNAHFADLCELETLNGKSVYTEFVCDYIEASNAYISHGHQQTFDDTTPMTNPLSSSGEVMHISKETAEDLQDLMDQFEQHEEMATEDQQAHLSPW